VAGEMNYPLFKVNIDGVSALHNISKVLASGFVNEGEQVIELELKLNKYFGTAHTVLVNSGTSAITLALRIAGAGPGDEVISTSMTCVASNTPIFNSGAKIVWADIDLNTGQISPEDILRKITRKTKAILVVDWAGTPCDLVEISVIAKEFNVPVIQDAAHAFGAMINDESIVNFADFTCFSFQAIKHFTTGDGGALVCRDEKDFALAKKLKWFGFDRTQVKDAKGEWKGQKWDADISPLEVGYKFNMNNIDAAIGLANLGNVENVLARHRANAEYYINRFKGIKLIDLLEVKSNYKSSYWVYTLLTKLSELQRDKLLASLNRIGIGAGLVHLPNNYYTAFKPFNTSLPNTEKFAASQISLPCGWWLSEGDCEYISDVFLDELNKIENSNI
jgi:perosamine synthetase